MKHLLAITAAILLWTGTARAQSTACTAQTLSQNLSAMADGQTPGSITPRALRNLACSGAGSVAPGADLSPGNVTATGGTTARATAAMAADTANVLNNGGGGHARRVLIFGVTTVSGQNTATLNTPLSSADIGSYIVIENAGTPTAGGYVSAVPVATAGSGYTGVPTIALANVGSGVSAYVTPTMKLISASVAGGGSGCSAGTQTFTVVGGFFGAAATFTGSVSAGALSGALTVVVPGTYSGLPSNTTTNPSTGGGCSVAPTILLSFGMGSTNIISGGYGYALSGVTASISGGSPGAAATLGAPTITLVAAPLATTITGVSGSIATLAANAGSSLTSATEYVAIGTGDDPAIAATIATSGGQDIWLPQGTYGITQPIVLNNGQRTRFHCGGSTIVALHPFSGAMLAQAPGGNFFASAGSVVEGCHLDAMGQAQYNINATLWGTTWSDLVVENASVTNILCNGLCENNTFGTITFQNTPSWAPLPSGYLIDVEHSDNTFDVVQGFGAVSGGIHVNSSGTHMHNAHFWNIIGGPNFDIEAPLTFGVDLYADTVGDNQSGIYLNASDANISGWYASVSGSYANQIGAHVTTNAANSVIVGGSAPLILFSNRFVQDTPYALGLYTGGNVFGYGGAGLNLGSNNTFNSTNAYGICAGFFSTCEGTSSFVAGQSNVSTGTVTTVLGSGTSDQGVQGSVNWTSAAFDSITGSAQNRELVLTARTTDGTTAVTLTSAGGTAAGFNQIVVPTTGKFTVGCRLQLTASSKTSGTDGAQWTSDNMLAINEGGTVTLIGTPTWTRQQATTTALTWTPPTFSADNTNKAVGISVTGIAATTIDWVINSSCVLNGHS